MNMKPSLQNNDVFRYGVSAGAALSADMVIYALLLACDVPYLLAAAFGFGGGLVLAYALNVRWVFSARRLSQPVAEFGDECERGLFDC
ncbi:MAG: GtrA family protein, partial [Pseudomonadota bacterium]